LLLVLLVIVSFSALPAAAASSANPIYGKIDLAFERNLGQADGRVEFLGRGSGHTVFLTQNEAVIGFTAPKTSAVRMKLLGQNRHPQV